MSVVLSNINPPRGARCHGRDGKKLSIPAVSLEGPPTILNSFSQSNDPYATEKRVLTHIGRIVKTSW